MPNYLMVLMAVSVGGMVVLQAGSNALLGRLLGHPLSASLTSLGVSLGAVCLGLLPGSGIVLREVQPGHGIVRTQLYRLLTV